ncbi:hypothetical protein [Dyella caseinilytica]|uniref:Uncharacterized protein n=1 Tax=Dyella caseinilytica TaxID=1849581 RepID=A0ABX7GSN2_9GAMM|nr:hypothetical protein [Dyella caseinilytica]QRN53417.1 hypothetical protein ISN74_18685 [Dyella caseinilytica]GFZ86353.1 hypothetical protein GCM10011408_00900 [Dyella caseinilytica]
MALLRKRLDFCKSKGTPEEYRTASLDSNAHYGNINGNQFTYTVAKPCSDAAERAHGEVIWQKLD